MEGRQRISEVYTAFIERRMQAAGSSASAQKGKIQG